MRIFPPFLAWFVLFCCIATAVRGEEGARVKTGEKVKSLIGIDEAVDRFMDQWDLPGGAVAITKDGRLVYARIRLGRRREAGAGRARRFVSHRQHLETDHVGR